MWPLHMEMAGVVKIMHHRNVRDYKLPELPRFSVDVYCPKTRTIYDSFEYYFHGRTCQPFRDATAMRGGTLAERYERTISRQELITRAGCLCQVPMGM